MSRRLLQSLETLTRVTPDTQRRRVLLLQTEAVTEVIQRTVPSPGDRAGLESYARRVSDALTKDQVEREPGYRHGLTCGAPTP